MSINKIKNAEIAQRQKQSSNQLKNDKLLYLDQNSNSLYLDKIKKELNNNNNSNLLNKILNEPNNKFYQKKYLKKINIFRKENNKIIYTRNNLSNSYLNNNCLISYKEKEQNFHSYRLMKETNLYQKMKEKFIKFKENKNFKNYSFTNNSTLSKNSPNLKINEENKIKNLKKNRTFMIKNYYNNNNNLINSKRFFNKINKDNEVCENSKNKLNQTIGKISIKSLEIENEDLNNKKIRINNNDRFNKIFNKYISNNIINGLNSFNKIKNLIKLKGFNLDKYDFNTIYKDENYYDRSMDNKTNINNKRKNINKVTKNENISNYFSFINNKNNSFDKDKNIIKKQKQYLSPVITKINQDKFNKLLNCNKLEEQNNIKNTNNNDNNDKEYIIYIINVVNKYYRDNNYTSIKDFYKEWVIENKNYISINDIHYYLNKVIGLNNTISKEKIKEVFFSECQLNSFNYEYFKKFFFMNVFSDLSDTGIKIENNKKEVKSKNHKINISESIKANKYNEIIQKINEEKEILIKTFNNNINEKSNYYLNFEKFYELIKNNLSFDSTYFFKDIIYSIYKKYYDNDNNKINILHFLKSINNSNNNIKNKDSDNNNNKLLNNLEKKNNKEKKENKCEIITDNVINLNEIKKEKTNNYKYKDFKHNEKNIRNLSYNNINGINNNKNKEIKNKQNKEESKNKKKNLETPYKNKNEESKTKNEESKNKNEESKNKNEDSKKYKKGYINNLKNKIKNNNNINHINENNLYINKITKLSFSVPRKKEKNSDIINIL